jgi:hypothetical protein
VDRLSEVTSKVEAVTLIVKEGVLLAMENCVTLQALEASTKDLMDKVSFLRVISCPVLEYFFIKEYCFML